MASFLKYFSGFDLKMACAKFQGNRFRMDGEIVKKHALQIYQKYNVSQARSIYILLFWSTDSEQVYSDVPIYTYIS